MIEPTAYDAIILAGGRGRRLGGVDKGALVVGGRSLLDTALAAARGARRIVVVGAGPVPAGVLLTREEPAFGGPAAGTVAGLRALRAAAGADTAARDSASASGESATLVLLLACDLPGAIAAVDLLRRAVDDTEPDDGWCLAEADGRLQWLCGLYRFEALQRAAAEIGDARDVSMGRLLRPLSLRGIPASPGLTGDVDTPADLDGLSD